MRKSILIALALMLLAGTASAKLGDLVASFPNQPRSPLVSHYGLAADANYLYSFMYYSSWRYPIIRMRRTTGAFVSSYPMPGATSTYPQYNRSISYGGDGRIYANNYSRRYVARFTASNGAGLSTWNWPTTMPARYSLAVDHKGTSGGTNIYQTYYTGVWYKSSLTGSLKDSWRRPNTNYAFDMAWDYGNNMIWYCNYSTEYIYGCNTRGSILKSWGVPVSVWDPYGIAYWGNYLYVSTIYGTPDEHIWVYHCPANVGVEPASVGKVKALFQ
ncbi:MAG: hypothetical protein V3T41_01630 [bacterium]